MTAFTSLEMKELNGASGGDTYLDSQLVLGSQTCSQLVLLGTRLVGHALGGVSSACSVGAIALRFVQALAGRMGWQRRLADSHNTLSSHSVGEGKGL